MDFFSYFSKYVIHQLWALKNGDLTLKKLREIEKYQYLPPDDLKELQLRRLKALLTHAYENCPYYTRKFSDYGISPSKIEDFDDIRQIPPLSKTDIQSSKEEMVAKNYPKYQLVEDRTGGSTAQPLQFYRNEDRIFLMNASRIRHNRWAGQDIGDKIGVIWGARIPHKGFKAKIRRLLLNRTLVCDSSSISDSGLLQFANQLKKFKPKGMLAYANSMYLFAKFVNENNIEGIKPYSIITSAELLHQHERELIEKVFGCKVFDRYGCREVGLIASECEKHNGLHMNSDSLLVEFMNHDGKPAKPGEEGNIYITDLFNFGMPFIRYKIEDIGMPSNQENCPCGRTLPLMKMVAGRVTDFLVGTNSKRVSGASLTIYLIANTKGVKQAQIIQAKDGAIRFKIVRGPNFDEESLEYLNSKIPEFFGGECEFKIEYVENIPKETSGKYRFSICKIGNRA